MINLLISPEEAKKLKTIPLSNDTISKRINEMATGVHAQTIQHQVNLFLFDLTSQTQEVINMAQFLCFIRYECNELIEENMLFCKLILDRAIGQGLFEVFIETAKNKKLD